jgi:hypothetical protein
MSQSKMSSNTNMEGVLCMAAYTEIGPRPPRMSHPGPEAQQPKPGLPIRPLCASHLGQIWPASGSKLSTTGHPENPSPSFYTLPPFALHCVSLAAQQGCWGWPTVGVSPTRMGRAPPTQGHERLPFFPLILLPPPASQQPRVKAVGWLVCLWPTALVGDTDGLRYQHEAANVGVLDRQTYQGGTRGRRLCSEDRDRETGNSKVCTRTRDTRFIQVRTAKVASPTSCLGDQVWRPALGVGLTSGARLGTRTSFI